MSSHIYYDYIWFRKKFKVGSYLLNNIFLLYQDGENDNEKKGQGKV